MSLHSIWIVNVNLEGPGIINTHLPGKRDGHPETNIILPYLNLNNSRYPCSFLYTTSPHTHALTRMHTNTHAHTQAHKHTHTHTHSHTKKPLNLHPHAQIHTNNHIYTDTYTTQHTHLWYTPMHTTPSTPAPLPSPIVKWYRKNHTPHTKQPNKNNNK